MVLGYILMGFLLLLATADVLLGNYSANEMRAYSITAFGTFFVILSAMVGSVRFGRHFTKSKTKIFALAGVLGSLVAPVVMPALLAHFEISQNAFLLYGGGWAAGVAAAIMIAMPVIERIERQRHATIYWKPPTDGKPRA